MKGGFPFSPSRLDLDNEKSEQRRRVGTIHILLSAVPGCPRLKVVWHLCHFGPGMVWAGGQGQGNICIPSESLAVCPPHGFHKVSHRDSLKNSFGKDHKCILWAFCFSVCIDLLVLYSCFVLLSFFQLNCGNYRI